MKWIISESSDVFYNLALEEFLCKKINKENCFILWINQDSVIVGRNQNIFEEVNVDEAVADGITLARRNSGGGTVFHDSGNINFSMIRDFNADAADQYEEFLLPVIDMLHSLGIPAFKRNKSDIAIMDNKISGNAQMIKGKRIVHHGTLLFDADLKKMKKYIKNDSSAYSSKAVRSVRSNVTNISLYTDIKIEEFKNYIISYFCRDGEQIYISREEDQFISSESEKLKSWEWVIGKSPAFMVKDVFFYGDNPLDIEIFVEKGIINGTKAYFAGEALDPERLGILQKCYHSKRYSEKYVKEVLEKNRNIFV